MAAHRPHPLDPSQILALDWSARHFPWSKVLVLAIPLLYISGLERALAQVPRDDFYAADGNVYSTMQVGNTLYLGGTFSRVGPATGGGVPIESATGQPASGFPKVNGQVWSVAPDGTGGWYIGGLFSAVGGQPRTNLAHVLSDNTVSSWAPTANQVVNAVAVSGSTVYVGGDFTQLGGQARSKIGAVDASTGQATAWNPNANFMIRCILVGGATVYVGGDFTTIGGQTRNRIAALAAATGLATAWDPNASSSVYSLALSGPTMYAGGFFTTIGGQIRNRLAALDVATGLATAWDPNANSLVRTVAVSETTVYVCGAFNQVGGQSRNYIAALHSATGLATSWDPGSSLNNAVIALALDGGNVYVGGNFTTAGSIGGQPRNYLAALDVATGLATDWNPNPAGGSVVALAVSGARVYAGGGFKIMGGQVRNSAAAIDVTLGTATAWNPDVSGAVYALAMSGDTVYLGGSFLNVGGLSRNSLAAVNATTGLPTAWNPNADYVVHALAAEGGVVYVGGEFSTIGGQSRLFLAAVDPSTGVPTAWNPGVSGEQGNTHVDALLVSGTTVYVGGRFTQAGSQIRSCIAAIDAATGLATAWNPNATSGVETIVSALAASGTTVYVGGDFTSIGGQSRTNVAAIDATTGLATTWNPDANQAVRCVAPAGTTVYVGGEFQSVGGQLRNSIAALDVATGLARAWNPSIQGSVLSLSVGSGEVYACGVFEAVGALPRSRVAAIPAPMPVNPDPDPKPDLVAETVGQESDPFERPTAPASTQWLLYQGACSDLAGGTWASRTTPVADSLNAYSVTSTGPYTAEGSPVLNTWWLMDGATAVADDRCSPQKTLTADRFFVRTDSATNSTAPGLYSAIRSCSIPIPPGTGSVLVSWHSYDELVRGSGLVRNTQYRSYRNGAWSHWQSAALSGRSVAGHPRQWTREAAYLANAAMSDSVQLRFTLHCMSDLSVDPSQCQSIPVGLLYDDFNVQITLGVPAPEIGVFVGSVAQTTFVDGTMLGTNCAAAPCWPGIRGTDLGAVTTGAIHDNFNSPLGDSITIAMASPIRPNGMGINWRDGFSKTAGGGYAIAHTNASYNPSYDTPRMIYRLFDPATKSWCAFDSTQLDADDVQIGLADTLVTRDMFRMNWPPRDKVAVGATLPGGFSINGQTAYSQLAFLPRGTRLQYYFKAVDILGGITYQFSSDNRAFEVEDLPFLPGSTIKAPEISEFDVLPRVYPPGAAGTLLAGRTDTPILNLDGAYSVWSHGVDPVTQALRGLGVRADRYRLLQGLGEGGNIGGHELVGQRRDRPSNYFPNLEEYGIGDSLATWYRIIIQSANTRTWSVFEEQDARLVSGWWNSDTGVNGGDRCILGSGDDLLHALVNTSAPYPQHAEQLSLATNVFGVSSVLGTWTGAATTPYPLITDTFAGIAYVVDGGCPGPNRFDGLTPVVAPGVQTAASYPGGVAEAAGVARSSELDSATDDDRSKALVYGFSLQATRTAGIPTTIPAYVHTGTEQRMQILFKFLTSCRTTSGALSVGESGAMTGANAATTPCWPCPSSPGDLFSNWASAPGFQTATYGSLYAIQDFTIATGIEQPAAPAPRYANSLSQNRPNPFNPATVIPYSLATEGRVSIRVFDVAGRLVRTLVDARRAAGPHTAHWDGRSDHGLPLASGIYFYTIVYPDGTVKALKTAILR